MELVFSCAWFQCGASLDWCDPHCFTMKVSVAAKNLFRQALKEAEVTVTLSDTTLDQLVRHVRQVLGHRLPQSLDDEQATLVEALLPIRVLVENAPGVDSFDERVWGTLLWNLFTACVNNTQGSERVPLHVGSEDLWQDMVTVLMASETVKSMSPQQRFPWWGRVWVIAIFIECLAICGVYISTGLTAGRSKLLAVFGSILIGLLGFLWGTFGWDLSRGLRASEKLEVSKLDLDRMSVKSRASSARLREENARLKRLVDERVESQKDSQAHEDCLRRAGVASGDGALMASLEALSGVPPTSGGLEKGAIVQFSNDFGMRKLRSARGVVCRVMDDSVDVKLVDGTLCEDVDRRFVQAVPLSESDPLYSSLMNLVFEVLGMSSAQPAEEEAKVYAPLAGSTSLVVMEQAKIVKEALSRWSARAALVPQWPKHFWGEVGLIPKLDPVLKGVLQAHGYLGDGKGVLPRHADLLKKLEEFESQGAPSHSAALFKLQEVAGVDEAEDTGMEAWETSLSSDLKRAAPEIYLSIRSAGTRNTREWVNSMFPVEKRSGPHYLEMFNCATLVDYEASMAKGGQADVLRRLAQSDVAEINLRRLAAWVHESRTGDKSAAASMLAVKPSNLNTDIGPQWLISEASTYSQAEHKRRERAKAQSGGKSKGGADAKGSGKGKSKKQKDGGGGAPKHTQG